MQCQVMSEMTKKTRYMMKVITSPCGTVLNSHCECTAGAGNKAKCKHVTVVLFGMEGLARTGQLQCRKAALISHNSGTSQLWSILVRLLRHAESSTKQTKQAID